MLRGVDVSVSGLVAGSHHQRVISINIANTNTPGFRAERAIASPFCVMLMSGAGGTTRPTASCLGPVNTGARIWGTYVSEEAGEIRETGALRDLALQGPGYFVIDGPEGPLLTRSARFGVDGEGYLTTREGWRLRSTGGHSPGSERADNPKRQVSTLRTVDDSAFLPI